MITFQQTGNFNKLTSFLEKSKGRFNIGLLDKYGRMGVDALSSATPVDTGLTARSWYYKVTHSTNGSVTLSFHNSNIQNGCPIAIILQYGHATNNGGWVEGIDYINPSIVPIFTELAQKAWEEVTK